MIQTWQATKPNYIWNELRQLWTLWHTVLYTLYYISLGERFSSTFDKEVLCFGPTDVLKYRIVAQKILMWEISLCPSIMSYKVWVATWCCKQGCWSCLWLGVPPQLSESGDEFCREVCEPCKAAEKGLAPALDWLVPCWWRWLPCTPWDPLPRASWPCLVCWLGLPLYQSLTCLIVGRGLCAVWVDWELYL